MSDEQEFRRALGTLADQATLRPEAERETLVRSKKRRRFTASVAAVLSSVVILAGVAGAYSILDSSPPAPPPASGDQNDANVGRYFFRASGDGMKTHGVLEVKASPASICYQGTTRGVVASHLVGLPDENSGFPHPAPVLITFFEPGNEDGATEPPGSEPLCLRGEELGEMESQLQALIDDPRLFKIDFHGPDETTATLEADLVPQGTESEETCGSPPVRPTYLPWLNQGDSVPPPRESYDAEIDRFSLGWDHPRSDGDRVGLSIYPLPNRESGGEGTNAYVLGVEGRLYRGEGESLTIAWDLDQRCNFLELVYANSELTTGQIETELIRTARSLEVPLSRDETPERCGYATLRPTYLPWAKEESEVGAPERRRSEDGQAAFLNWFRSDEFPPVYAQLSVATNQTPAKGQPTGIFRQGAEGELDIHAGSTMSISWDNDNSTCNDLRLELVMPNGTPSSRVESEIKKIAESLEADQ